MKKIILLCSILLSIPSLGLIAAQADDGGRVAVRLQDATLHIIPLTDNAVRIQYRTTSGHQLPELVYVDTLPVAPSYKVKESTGATDVKLRGMSVHVDKQTGRVVIYDSKNKKIFEETGCQLKPASVQGESTYSAELRIKSPADEFLFGLGQFQDGYLNVRGLSRRLTQVNTQISIPFLLSSRGYGLLWNNYGLTDFNPADSKVVFQKESVEGMKTVVDVTSTEGTKKEVRESNTFTSSLEIPVSGRYALLLDVGQQMARKHHLVIDGKTVMDMKNLWLPPTSSVIVELEAGTHQLTAQLEKEDRPILYYKKVEDETVFRSPVAESVDYTVFVGDANEIVSTYRKLTGNAPMMPAWALGYIHCRERFHSQEEILATTKRFRDEQIPMDVMVQDWQYWGKHGWNAMRFDEAHYPDPKQLVDQLHAMNAKFMLSVWSKIDPQSEVGRQMEQKGYYIANTSWIDFFNPDAAAFYWTNFSNRLLKSYGIDAWWQDATEPENDDLAGRKVMNGTLPGEIFRNVYPMLVNKTVYEGCRTDDPSRRTMVLTRSGFSGIQRYGAALWSGDVGHDWETLKRQIAGGLGLMSSGIPWWTYDAGGFFRPQNQYQDKSYHERFLRWLQTATFLPLMRVHGYMTNTEFWNYGEEVTRIARKSLDTRYRLFPYIYSENARVTFEGSTLMRPLVMDYRTDPEALAQNYEFMFGPSLLVAPVLEESPVNWRVYLPQTPGGWYDFYSGAKIAQKSGYIEVPVSLDHIPVFVKAGTILPLSASVQHTQEIADAAWEIHVYPGADAEFVIYEDEGTNYNYEKGQYATYRLEWKDAKNELVLHPRNGSYPGMCRQRNFNIIRMDTNGDKPLRKELVYDGKKVTIKL